MWIADEHSASRSSLGASPGGDAIELRSNSEALFVNLAHLSTRRTPSATPKGLLKESSRARQNWHWLVGIELLFSKSLVFVFVYLPEDDEPEFYVVPSLKIKRVQKDKDKKTPYVRKADIATYQDNRAS